MIFYTADLHLGSYRNLHYRPFDTVEQMDQELLKNFNARIKKNDTLVIVGDVGSCSRPPFDVLQKMHGRKILIIGNNDIPVLESKRMSKKFRECFAEIHMGNYSLYDKYLGSKVFLNHYPCASWNGSRMGIPHFYGHLHSLKEDGYEQMLHVPNAYNVGIDVRGYEPLTATEIIEWGKIVL